MCPLRFAVYVDMAAGLFHEAVDHAQSQSAAFASLLGREKGLEDARQDVRGDARARVTDFDAHVVARPHVGVLSRVDFIEVHVGGFDYELSSIHHCITGIGRKIDDGSFELSRIDANSPWFALQLEPNLYVLPQSPAQKRGSARDQRVGVNAFRTQRLSSREGEESPREVGAAQGSIERIGQQFAAFAVLAQAAAQQVEIADDDAEEIVEIMRHSAGEIADGLHFCACRN